MKDKYKYGITLLGVLLLVFKPSLPLWRYAPSGLGLINCNSTTERCNKCI